MSLLGAAIRTISGPAHLVPDFLIIGAMKGGTTSMFRYLAAHPRVAYSSPKEVHYFDDHYEKGLAWYRHHFPTHYSREGRAALRCGEASPYYLFYEPAPARVRESLPDVQLIAMLRDPVSRAYSHYHHAFRHGKDERSFEDAVDAELHHLESGGAEPLYAGKDPADCARRLRYIARGFYAEQLERWFALFPRERFLILRSEDMFGDPAPMYNHVLDWLGLPPFTPEEFMHKNQGGYKSKIEEATRDRLRAYYKPHNDRLEALLGRSMDWKY